MKNNCDSLYDPIVLESLLDGLSNWTNVQDIVRLSFKALADIIKAQGSSLRELEKSLPLKISKTEALAEIEKKPDICRVLEHFNDFKKEIKNSVSELNSKVSEKVSLNDLHLFFKEKISKQDFEYSLNQSHKELIEKIQDLDNRIQAQEDKCLKDIECIKIQLGNKASLDEMSDKLNFFCEKINSDNTRQEKLLKKIEDERLLKIEESIKLVESSFSGAYNDIKSLDTTFATKLGLKADTEEVYSLTETLEQRLKVLENSQKKVKIDSKTLSESINSMQKTQSSQFLNLDQSHQSLTNTQQNLNIRINCIFEELEKISKNILSISNSVEDLGLSKFDKESLKENIDKTNYLINLKLNSQEFHDHIRSLESLIRDKVTNDKFEDFSNSFKDSIDKIHQQLVAKGNIKDICVLLDMKPNIEDINQALTEIHTELDEKVTEKDFKTYTNQQKNINKLYSSEHSLGKWAWLAGSTNKTSISFEKEVTNTYPENYIYEDNSPFILVSKGGFYEICLGMFCSKKPNIQILVNGEVIISAINNSNYIVTNNTGKLKNSGITGISLVEYLNLPNKARLSVAVNGNIGEGFMSLKKIF